MSYRPQITNRAGFAKHAAPEAIAHHLAAAAKAQIEATREVAWLTQLLEDRQRQVAAGEWPPPAKTEVQCRTCGSIVWTWEAAHHLATEHPELPDPAQVRIYDLRTEAATPDTGSTT